MPHKFRRISPITDLQIIYQRRVTARAKIIKGIRLMEESKQLISDGKHEMWHALMFEVDYNKKINKGA